MPAARRRLLPTLLAAVVALACCAAALGAPPSDRATAGAVGAPGAVGGVGGVEPVVGGVGDVEPVEPGVDNVVLLVVDDMSDVACRDTATVLPRSALWLRDLGTCYENATTATPVCCPARSQILTGQLSHNNGVRRQVDAWSLDPGDTVPDDLDAAGWRTYAAGKYLNGVKAADFAAGRWSGFDEFDLWDRYTYAPGTYRTYAEDGTSARPAVPATQAVGDGLVGSLEDYADAGEPFFLYGAFYAPHAIVGAKGWEALPQPSEAHADAVVPGFRYAPEVDARDKLPLFQRSKPWWSREYFRALYEQRRRAMLDVDDQVARVFESLLERDLLDRTAVVLVSDNGLADRNQSNWEAKAVPYPAATDVPLLAWWPGRAPATDRRPVGLIDLAPTVYELLGVTPEHVMDGHSLLGPHRRSVQYLEFFTESSRLVAEESGEETTHVPSWKMLRLADGDAYVEWYRGDGRLRAREYYADPGMTRNLLHYGQGPRRARLDALRAELRRLAGCRGTVESGSRRPCT
ncbi:hypothetical protein GCM10023340_35400 [Nocardioides marinquilinus]|uniref:Sulfatase N-terminal domain-containing protein n=1 Tax=Nocardioides marinquilinus TaxID=1210400 RepID=A0ABP9PX66_9ACTN